MRSEDTCVVVGQSADGKIVGYGKASHVELPAAPPPRCVPAGWYLSGLVVSPAYRRRGIGLALTRSRLDWLAQRASQAWYVANAHNEASIRLHARLGFVEVDRGVNHPAVTFDGGVGVLYRLGTARER